MEIEIGTWALNSFAHSYGGGTYLPHHSASLLSVVGMGYPKYAHILISET